MPPRSIRDFIDVALGGKLNEKLREHGRPGPSFEALASELNEQGIAVSAESLRRWARELENDEQVPA